MTKWGQAALVRGCIGADMKRWNRILYPRISAPPRRIERLIRQCEWCDSWWIQGRPKTGQRYCSRDCFNEARRIPDMSRRLCLTPGCGRYAVAGRSRCGRCGPTNAARRGPSPYDSAHQQRRKARLKAGEGCALRYLGGCRGDLHLDHIVPLSMGGRAVAENEQILCQRHNISKGGANRVRR
jgi:5-methylcytosine-specific restriction endonuclease McrA